MLETFKYAVKISIHIPRVGDDAVMTTAREGWDISIHIPRVGDDDLTKRAASSS